MENVKADFTGSKYIKPYTDFGFKNQASVAIARSLKASGLDVDFIAENTGLSTASITISCLEVVFVFLTF